MSILFNDIFDHGDSDGNILDSLKKPKSPLKPPTPKSKHTKCRKRKIKSPDICNQRMEELATPKRVLLEATLALYHRTLEPKRIVRLVRLIHEINEPKPHRTFQINIKRRKRKPKKRRGCGKENAERVWLKLHSKKAAKLIVEYLHSRTKFVPNYKQLQVAMQLSKKLKYKKKKDISRMTKLELDKICQQLAIICDTKFEPYKRSIRTDTVKSETTISEADKKRCLFSMKDFTFESEESESEFESEEGEGEGEEFEGAVEGYEFGEEYGLISELELEFESMLGEGDYAADRFALEGEGEGSEFGDEFGEGGRFEEDEGGEEDGEREREEDGEGEDGQIRGFGEGPGGEGEWELGEDGLGEEEEGDEAWLASTPAGDATRGYGEYGYREGGEGYVFGEGGIADEGIVEWERAIDEIIEGLAAEGLTESEEESLFGEDEEALLRRKEREEKERLEMERLLAHPEGTATYVSWSMYSSWLNEFEKNINLYTDCLQQFGQILRDGEYGKYQESVNKILTDWSKYLSDAKRVDENMINYFKSKPITKCSTCADYDLTNIPTDHEIPEELLEAVKTTEIWKKLLEELVKFCKTLGKPKLVEDEEEEFTSSETIDICDVKGSSSTSGFFVEDKD